MANCVGRGAKVLQRRIPKVRSGGDAPHPVVHRHRLHRHHRHRLRHHHRHLFTIIIVITVGRALVGKGVSGDLAAPH